ncbi:MAG: DUF512 domain-containing protein, partial [Oscillospiraceae bacterium]|nr:DUF512 domain-containing protein [Oscillospiraceae bacterium]
INAQIVLCPGYNDGAELERSLRGLCGYAPALQSVSVVPVGITRCRENLPPMRAFTPAEAGHIIETVKLHGGGISWPGDEFFLIAGRDIPPHEYYGDYHQLENGVGMSALLRHEFCEALSQLAGEKSNRAVTVATGAAAYPLISELAGLAQSRFAGLRIQVSAIQNDFFGHSVTVAGLVCGGDLIRQLPPVLGDELLLPASMLRSERDLFLDGVSVSDVECALNIPVRVVEIDGYALLDAMLGK